MKKHYFLLLFVFFCTLNKLKAQVTLSHNVGNELVQTHMFSCSYGGTDWARTFVLQDFGVDTSQGFIINSGQTGFANYVDWGNLIKFNIYSIDSGFPGTFSNAVLIGSSQEQTVPMAGYGLQMVNVIFDTPVIVPPGVEMILVEVQQVLAPGNWAPALFMSGTAEDNDISYFKPHMPGCGPMTYTNTLNINVSDAKLYIVVNGQSAGPYSMMLNSNCASTVRNFSLTNTNAIALIQWDFGDIASGANNISTAINPSHNFSAPGTYSVIATVTNNLGVVDHVMRRVQVMAPPVANALPDIFACEDIAGSGVATTFNTSAVEQSLLAGQTGKTVSYYDERGNALPSPLPNPIINTTRNSQAITARVSNAADASCYDETTFNLRVNPLPVAHTITTLYECDDNNDGLAAFNLSAVEATLLGGQTGMAVSYISEGRLLPMPLPTEFNTSVANRQTITAIVTNPVTGCTADTDFLLVTQPKPFANAVPDLLGCDDNGDGISQYFDTSGIEDAIIGNQAGVALTFNDVYGNSIAAPANLYTNSVPHQEVIIARVTNIQTGCYAQTPVTFITTIQPTINTPSDIFACDEGNGFAHFDTSLIEQQLTGGQPGLILTYRDASGHTLPSPLPALFLNTVANHQSIHVKAEHISSTLCYSETEFNLIVNPLPQIDIESTYHLCDLLPSLRITANPGFNSWEWKSHDGTIVSTNYYADVSVAGNYTLTVTQHQNGISCTETFSFSLERSQVPVITNVISHDLSNNNSLEIIASGDGNLQYSIDGVHYYNNNVFSGLDGGIYKVYVKDRGGCGWDWKEVVLLNYPKFFSPNGDGQNDLWQVVGMKKFPAAKILIFDRFGRLLSQIKPGSTGWNGQSDGAALPSSDYWFTVDLANGKTFNGHFSLIR